MRDKSGGGGCGGGQPQPTTNPRVLVGVSPLTTSNPSSTAESLILLPVSASGRVFFKTEVTTGRIPDVMDHLLWMTACVLNGGKAEAIQQRHYQEVAALSRRAANARTWTQETHRGRSKTEEWSWTGNRGVTSLFSNADRFLWVCSFLALILCVGWAITSSRNECAGSHSVVKASGLSIQRDKWHTKEKEISSGSDSHGRIHFSAPRTAPKKFHFSRVTNAVLFWRVLLGLYFNLSDCVCVFVCVFFEKNLFMLIPQSDTMNSMRIQARSTKFELEFSLMKKNYFLIKKKYRLT